MSAETWHWVGRGRRPAVAASVLATWAVLLALYLAFEAAGWLMAALALFTLPACRDWIADPSAGVEIDPVSLTWHSGRRSGRVTLSEIDFVRLDTRLDLSVRATIVTRSRDKYRLPFEATPPHRAFEAALAARGIAVERHHFSFVG
ncbi:hypothetical protein R5H30_05760 [Sulfitobacter sp. D35]|uniref:hypothetical protein n=1 Tax=Sulfitobacter sp. D35 TaxID=3083252 RepID=UPI00296F6316|nr:hypothetical protein [Sulfitobacter sp. D35]MDW4497479.1 hypothetical protein [Sulfitobacter sp. D35]